MQYERIYNNIINRARNRSLKEYSEKHHVIPKCMGGTDEPENIVELTGREHYVVHQLLIKIYPNNPSLIYAANMMRCMSADFHPGRSQNKAYGWLKRKYSELRSLEQSGERNSQYGSMWIHNGTENRKIRCGETIPFGWIRGRVNVHSEQSKQTLRNKNLGKRIPEHQIKILSERMKGNTLRKKQ